MKIKSLLGLIGFLSSSLLFSQTGFNSDNEQTAEVVLNLQVGSSPISFDAPGLRYRFFLHPDLAIRASLLATYYNNSEVIYDAGDRTLTGTKDQNNWSVGIGLGIEKHIGGEGKLQPYYGGQIVFGTGGASASGTNTLNGFVYVKDGQYENSISGVYSFAANLLFGADYYFVENIYVGAEIGFGINHQFNGYQQQWDNVTDKTVETKLMTVTNLGISSNNGIRMGIRF